MYLIHFPLTGAFESFICYNISVYPLFENKIGAPYSVQAYFQEKRMYMKLPILPSVLLCSVDCSSS